MDEETPKQIKVYIQFRIKMHKRYSRDMQFFYMKDFGTFPLIFSTRDIIVYVMG